MYTTMRSPDSKIDRRPENMRSGGELVHGDAEAAIVGDEDGGGAPKLAC
jgi:hypothetical protein